MSSSSRVDSVGPIQPKNEPCSLLGLTFWSLSLRYLPSAPLWGPRAACQRPCRVNAVLGALLGSVEAGQPSPAAQEAEQEQAQQADGRVHAQRDPEALPRCCHVRWSLVPSHAHIQRLPRSVLLNCLPAGVAALCSSYCSAQPVNGCGSTATGPWELAPEPIRRWHHQAMLLRPASYDRQRLPAACPSCCSRQPRAAMQSIVDAGRAAVGKTLSTASAVADDVRIAAPNFQVNDLPDNAKRECILFYYPESESLARQIAEGNSHVRLGSIRWKCAPRPPACGLRSREAACRAQSRAAPGYQQLRCHLQCSRVEQSTTRRYLCRWFAELPRPSCNSGCGDRAACTCALPAATHASQLAPGCMQQRSLQPAPCGCRSFPDGFPNLFVRDADKIRNRHVAFLASFQHPATIFEQLSVIYQLPRMFVGSFTLVLPYFPTGTAERVRPGW